VITNRDKRGVRAIFKEMDRRDEDAKTQRPMRVGTRNSDGTLNFRSLNGECIERGSACSFDEGMVVLQPCRPAFQLQGAAGLAMASSRRAIATLWVESLDPEELPQGWSGTVIVTGKGFKPTTVIEFLALDGETINEDVAVSSIAYVDEETLELAVVVADDAELPDDGVTWPIAFDNPGEAL
jgi:hypothetical protein